MYYSHVADHHGDPYTNITNGLVRRRADATGTFGATVSGGDQNDVAGSLMPMTQLPPLREYSHRSGEDDDDRSDCLATAQRQ